MTAAAVIARAQALGAEVTLVGTDSVRVRAPAEAVEAVVPLIRSLKTEVIAELLRRETALSFRSATSSLANAADALVAAQRLLRFGRWPPAIGTCPFHIGKSGARCRRCGAPWLEHFSPTESVNVSQRASLYNEQTTHESGP